MFASENEKSEIHSISIFIFIAVNNKSLKGERESEMRGEKNESHLKYNENEVERKTEQNKNWFAF